MITRRELLAFAACSPIFNANALESNIPVITGPIEGGRVGRPFSTYLGDLDAFGYIEEEYFVRGTASSYRPQSELGINGEWSVASGDTAPFVTRVLVRRPRDSARFNGTLVVEWVNVTAGYEIATIGGISSGVYESGFAFAVVSCQQIGHTGFAKNPQGLKQWDPDRYAPLSHPGDAYSYDIFTKVSRALRNSSRSKVNPLGGLDVQRTIAIGASQSAIRLRTYINAVQPKERAFDGIVTALDFGNAAPFDNSVYDPTQLTPGDTGYLFKTYSRIREDQSTPVMVVNSEFETLRYLPSAQDDNDHFRFWEIAGASHVPAQNERAMVRERERDGIQSASISEGASEVMWQPTADAALDRMNSWIKDGVRPPGHLRIEVEKSADPKIVRDDFGNARGGVRLPELEVPLASYNGTGTGARLLAGSTSPFSPEQLQMLYPSKTTYLEAVIQSAQRAEAGGVITASRRAEYFEFAEMAHMTHWG